VSEQVCTGGVIGGVQQSKTIEHPVKTTIPTKINKTKLSFFILFSSFFYFFLSIFYFSKENS